MKIREILTQVELNDLFKMIRSKENGIEVARWLMAAQGICFHLVAFSLYGQRSQINVNLNINGFQYDQDRDMLLYFPTREKVPRKGMGIVMPSWVLPVLYVQIEIIRKIIITDTVFNDYVKDDETVGEQSSDDDSSTSSSEELVLRVRRKDFDDDSSDDDSSDDKPKRPTEGGNDTRQVENDEEEDDFIGNNELNPTSGVTTVDECNPPHFQVWVSHTGNRMSQGLRSKFMTFFQSCFNGTISLSESRTHRRSIFTKWVRGQLDHLPESSNGDFATRLERLFNCSTNVMVNYYARLDADQDITDLVHGIQASFTKNSSSLMESVDEEDDLDGRNASSNDEGRRRSSSITQNELSSFRHLSKTDSSCVPTSRAFVTLENDERNSNFIAHYPSKRKGRPMKEKTIDSSACVLFSFEKGEEGDRSDESDNSGDSSSAPQGRLVLKQCPAFLPNEGDLRTWFIGERGSRKLTRRPRKEEEDDTLENSNDVEVQNEPDFLQNDEGIENVDQMEFSADDKPSSSSSSSSSGDEFEVEKVITHKIDFNVEKRSRIVFKIRWLGYGPDEDTWEPIEQVGHIDVVRDYIMNYIGHHGRFP